MGLPLDAVPLEDWELMQKGLPVPKKPKIQKVDPELPEVENEIKCVPEGEVNDIMARRQTVQNKDGVNFCGVDLWIKIGGVELEGWLPESEFLKVKRRIPLDRVDLLQKCGI